MQAEKVVIELGATPSDCKIFVDGEQMNYVLGVEAIAHIDTGVSVVLNIHKGEYEDFETIEFIR